MKQVLAFLKERWLWWLLPILILTAATAILLYTRQSTVVAPFRYQGPGS